MSFPSVMAMPLWAPAAWMILSGLAYGLFGRDRRLVALSPGPFTEMIPALEAGVAADSVVQGEDLSVQLLQWAREGHVRLRYDGVRWHIHPGTPPKESAPPYAREAWTRLFARKGGTEAARAEDLLAAGMLLQEGSEAAFRCPERAMMHPGASRVARSLWVADTVLLVALVLINCLARGLNLYFIAPMAILAGSFAVFSAWMTGWVQRYLALRSRRRNEAALLLMLLADVAMVALAAWMLVGLSPEKGAWMRALAIAAAAVFSTALAPLVERRSDYGYDLLCHIKGLREELTDAAAFPCRGEGETETDYFWRMLPYALALGEEDGFAARIDPSVTVPGWLDWQGESFSPKALNRALHRFRTSMAEEAVRK